MTGTIEDKLNIVSVAMIHNRKDLIPDAIHLLNSQWPRGTATRKKILSNSSDDLPCCVVMLNKDDKVIGHGKISRVPMDSSACFVESVVILPELRGHGYGRRLMNELEKLAFSLGFEWVYLTTTDQQGFYTRIGYELTNPICFYGGSAGLIDRAPGRVVTLIPSEDPEERVWGIAYKIPEDKIKEVIDHLDHREKGGYEKVGVMFYPKETDNSAFQLHIYLGNHENPFFCGGESVHQVASVIAESVGPSGKNTEYLYNLVAALREIGYKESLHDIHLHELEKAVRSIEGAQIYN